VTAAEVTPVMGGRRADPLDIEAIRSDFPILGRAVRGGRSEIRSSKKSIKK